MVISQTFDLRIKNTMTYMKFNCYFIYENSVTLYVKDWGAPFKRPWISIIAGSTSHPASMTVCNWLKFEEKMVLIKAVFI